jgi:hypothetical protein
MACGKRTDVESYCATAEPFARPVLKKLRTLWRKAAPKASEIMKWGSPHFEGQGLIGGMSAFKRHVSLTLWNARAIPGAEKHFPAGGRMPMGTLKVASADELPSDAVLLKLFRAAARLDAEGARPVMKKPPRLLTPRDFRAAMKPVPKAAATYEALSPSCKREYVAWIEEAKRDATRAKRIATAVEWLAEGKQRNWRYR